MRHAALPWFVTALLLWAPQAYGVTVTFDDVSTGQNLAYYLQRYGLYMGPGWEVIDSAGSGWGTPHSGTQCAVWNGNPKYGTAFDFGVDGVSEYSVRSVAAYFTTQPGVVLEMQGYTASGVIARAGIGDTNGYWTNRYVEISSAAGDILFVHIAGVGSSDFRYHFSMDDLTIVPVPEPSPLLALSAFLAPIAGLAIRRRR